MEIERKFLVRRMPEHPERYPHQTIIQGYLSTDPVVRVRKDGDSFYLTYKGSGLYAHEEANLPLTEKSFDHLLKKADGMILKKERYRIPDGSLTIELDIFSDQYEGLTIAEVEFPTKEEAENFSAPDWFGEDVTGNPLYHNSTLSAGKKGQKG